MIDAWDRIVHPVDTRPSLTGNLPGDRNFDRNGTVLGEMIELVVAAYFATDHVANYLRKEVLGLQEFLRP